MASRSAAAASNSRVTHVAREGFLAAVPLNDAGLKIALCTVHIDHKNHGTNTQEINKPDGTHVHTHAVKKNTYMHVCTCTYAYECMHACMYLRVCTVVYPRLLA